MDLTFQVPTQHCSLQHRTFLLSPVTSTTECCFCFASVSSFFLELFLHWSLVAYWVPTDLASSSFSILSFCLFMLFMGFSRQEYWSGLPFLLQWTTFCQTSPPWSDHLGWPYTAWLSFIELDKAVVHVIRSVSFLWLWFQSVCPHALSQCLLSYSLSLTLDGVSLMAAPAKHSCCSLPWMWGFSYHERGVSPLSGSPLQHCTATSPGLLGHFYHLLGHFYHYVKKLDIVNSSFKSL